MKGSIFKLLEHYADTTWGPDSFEDLLDDTELETTEPFVGPGDYPAGDLVALVTTACRTHEVELADLLRGFGRHAFPMLAESVPTLLEGLDTPRQFLTNLESVIHTEVRKLDPQANPARFSIPNPADDVIHLHYESDLGLFPLVEGFLDGIAAWFGEAVEHRLDEVDGTNATFLVSFPEEKAGVATGTLDHAGA
ncbi:MAG: heme NO-binding domain-containing protein [Actinomycetota bacterium]